MTTPTTVNIRLQLRADTAANWTAANPTLLANEVGLETDTKKLKVGDGTTAWASLAYFPSIVTGGTVLGNLEIGSTGTLTFEGSTADGFETTLAVTDPTADRTITLPDQSGTVVVSGNASIVDADIAAGAEIAVSKLANGTANQVLVTDGTDVSWSDNLTLAGDLTVNGTTTTINTQDLLVEDKNIIIGNVDTPTDVTADGGGITLKGATDKTINWVDSTDAWTSSERFSVPLGSAASPSLTFTGDENTGIYSPGADQLALSTNGTEALRIDADGNILIATDSARAGVPSAVIQVDGTSATASRISVIRNSNDINNSAIVLGKSRGTTPGSNAILQSGDVIGNLVFAGADGVDLNSQAATIQGNVDGATGADIMPGRLVFSTNPGTFGASPQECLRITSAGRVGIGVSAPTTPLTVGSTVNGEGILIQRTSTTAEDYAQIGFAVTTSATPTQSSWIRAIRKSAGVDDIALGTNATERLRIDSSGRAGVGTASPGSYNANANLFVLEKANECGLTIATTSTGANAKSVIHFADGTTGTSSYAGYIAYLHDSDALQFATNTSERMRLDSSGRLLVGTSSAPNSAESYAKVQIADPVGPHLILGREDTTVTTDEALGLVRFYSKAGNSWQEGARIAAFADAGQGLDDKPSRLVFSTTADAASSPTERMRIGSDGFSKFTHTGAYNDPGGSGTNHYFQSNIASSSVLIITAYKTSFASTVQQNSCLRSASSSYSLFKGVSGNGSTSFADNEFNLRGDGYAFADGTWSGGGADYAEYFEWSDLNPNAEDRRGISVVLEGNMIREAQPGEDPIGVISGNPSVVGDAAWNKWNGKYLRDEFGTYIQEDYEVTDDDGNTVVQQRRKLNPAYDPDVEYVSREERPEWDCVGLMGKLRIRKGQVTGSRWIKMRDISDSVEEWLVR